MLLASPACRCLINKAQNKFQLAPELPLNLSPIFHAVSLGAAPAADESHKRDDCDEKLTSLQNMMELTWKTISTEFSPVPIPSKVKRDQS